MPVSFMFSNIYQALGRSNTARLYCLVLVIPLVLLSCQHELYFDQDPVSPVADTTTVANSFPLCAGCIGKDAYDEDRWSLKADTAFLCGTIDTAIISLERDAFTLFGPSSCSPDTGFILTAYLSPLSLHRDTTNMRIGKVSFFLYDKGKPHIFMSRPASTFVITIVHYDHQSKIATASFEGYGYRQNGLGSFINSGKFKITLH
jgi:hypothetical protein